MFILPYNDMSLEDQILGNFLSAFSLSKKFFLIANSSL